MSDDEKWDTIYYSEPKKDMPEMDARLWAKSAMINTIDVNEPHWNDGAGHKRYSMIRNFKQEKDTETSYVFSAEMR